jgi:argininosuccinate lyase
MPQKKNPDIAELVRGRAGRSIGGLVALATVLKGLPLAYDRDLQEDKIALFSTVGNAQQSLEAVRLMAERLVFDRERLEGALADPDLYATDSAERLVKEGTPFRQAHREVGEQVVEGTHLAPWGAAHSLELRDFPGAPGPDRVRARAAEVAELARGLEAWAKSHPPPLP